MPLSVNYGEDAVDVVITHYVPAVPAYISGPMEDCYPEEPAVIEFSFDRPEDEAKYGDNEDFTLTVYDTFYDSLDVG